MRGALRWERGLPLAVACGLLALALPAAAQQAEASAAPSSFDDPYAGSPEAAELGELSLEELLSVEIVEAASRREQTLHDAPSAVTVIERQAIEQMGAVNVAELMRRVPGAHVVRLSNNSYEVALRNISGANTSRTLVLLDGRPVLDPVIAFPPYNFLPVNPLELDRVEVVRGPGSTLYGAGAVGGVVRLQTRRPIDHPGLEGDVNTGLAYLPKGEGQSRSLTMASYGHTAYNYANQGGTFGVRLAVGFGLAQDAGEIPHGDQDLGEHNYHTGLTLDWRPDADTTGYLAFTQSSRDTKEPFAQEVDDKILHYREQAVTLNFERRDMLHDHLTTSLIADFTHVAETSLGNGDSLRYHALWLNDLSLFDERSVTTLGGEITYADGDGGVAKPKNLAYSLVAQQDLILLPSRALVISGAARFETIRYRDGLGNDVYYRNTNPRVSVIGKIGEDHDVRVTAASAYRLPSSLEISTGASLPDPAGVPRRLVVPNDALKPEQSQSLELGYRGDLYQRLRVELVGYLQRIENVVFPTIDGGLPLVYENAEAIDQIGVEFSSRVAVSNRSDVYANVAGRRSRSDDPSLPPNFPKAIFGVGTDNTLPRGVRLHADASFVLDYNSITIDSLQGTPLLVTRIDSVPNQIDVNLRLGKLILDGHAEIYLLGRNLAAFVRDRSDLVQYKGTFAPIPVGATVLVGVSVKEI